MSIKFCLQCGDPDELILCEGCRRCASDHVCDTLADLQRLGEKAGIEFSDAAELLEQIGKRLVVVE